MAIRIFFFSFLLILISIIFTGCATAIKGYEDKVELLDADSSLQIFTEDGISVEVNSKKVPYKYFDSNKQVILDTLTKYYINLRSDQTHLLTLESNGKKKKVEVYPKIGAGWLFIDIITGVLPAIIDIYTGSWNFFDPIKVEL